MVKPVIELASEVSKFKKTEDLTKNTDIILASLLTSIITKEDDYYYVKDIRKKLSEWLGYDEPP